MSKEEIREVLINFIRTTSNEELLKDALTLFGIPKGGEPPAKLPDEVIEIIEEGRKDIAEGRVFTHEEVMERVRKWTEV